MKVLFDICHPAQLHLYRNTAHSLMARGDEVLVVGREKDVLMPLLELYKLPVVASTRKQPGRLGTVKEWAQRARIIFNLARKHDVDFLVGPICQVSKVVRARSLLFAADDTKIMPAYVRLVYPFADAVVTPSCLASDRGFGPHHVTYEGYHQLAYLHPNHFEPDPTILQELGVGEGEPYFMMRFVELKAHHDKGHQGMGYEFRVQLVKELEKRGRVFITTEGALGPALQAYQIGIAAHRIHHAMAFARMFIGDSQSMTAEAAVLGVPAIRCNTFVGVLAYIEELEHKYGLAYGFRPGQEEAMLAKIVELLDDPELESKWQAKRQVMLAEKTDVAAWMLDFLDRFPQSYQDCIEAQTKKGG